MNLFEQLLSFMFSFFYGMIVSFAYKKTYKYLYFSKKKYSFFNSLIFSLLVIIIYFKILYFINGGIINIYFLLLFGLGFYLFNKIFTKKMSKK